MVTYKLLRTLCPKCNRGLYRGSRVIGPGTVVCKKCGEKISLNLTEWKNLSTGNKIWQVIREFFSPTFWGADSGSVRIMTSFFIWLLAATPFILIGTIPIMADPQHAPTTPFAEIWLAVWGIIGLLFYQGLIVLRLVRMIKESNKFAETKEPPRW